MSPRLLRPLAWIGGYLACLALWLSYAPYGFNPWDECVLAYGALRVLAGQMVWVDFFGYAPGRYLLAATLDHLFGTSLLTLRVGFCALTAAMPLLAYSIGRRLMPRAWALVPAVLVALGPSVYYFRSYPLVALLGGWSLCRLVEAPSRARQAAHGLVLVACTLLESAAGGFVVLLTPLALWASPSPWLAGARRQASALLFVFGAALLGALPVLGFYAWHGKLLEALSLQTYRYVVTGASMWVAYPSPWEALLSGGFHPILQASFFWAMALALAGAAALASVSFLRGRRLVLRGDSPAADPQLLVICLLGVLNFLLPVYRAGFYNVLRASPLPWILGAFLASRRLGGFGLLYAGLFALHLTTAPAYRSISTGGPPGAAFQDDLVSIPDDRSGVLMERRHAELLRDALAWIDQTTGPGDPIFAVPLNPLFYYFGRRDNPTGHDYILPGYWRDPGQIAETLQALERRPPKLFLYCDVPVDGWSERRFSATSAPIYDYFVRRYAWFDRHPYSLWTEGDITFTAFRRLRPSAHWPGLETSSRGLVPARTRGPVRIGALEVAGREATGWILGPGAVVEVETSAPGPQVFLFRPHCPEPGAAWSLPELRISALGPDGTASRTLRLAARDPADDGPLPPMVSVSLAAGAGVRPVLRLEVLATRSEHLRGSWQIVQPCLLEEAAAFYGRSEWPGEKM
jgi:hypothetical protein